MKAFFTISQDGKDKAGSTYSTILNVIKKNFSVVKTKDYVNFDINDEKELETQFINIYETSKRNIISSDIVIAEATYPTTSIGYDIALSVENNKPTLVLIDEKTNSKSIPSVIKGNKSRNLVIKYYNKSNLEDIIKDFISQSKKLLDSKFILIIPPEIERYLSWSANKRGVRKAEIVRVSIDKYMEIDEEYQKYLKGLEG